MSELSPELWALVAIVGAIQVGLMIVGYVVLFRTPAQRLTAPRWLWAVICLVQFGALVFLLMGRKPAPIAEPGSPVPAGSTTITQQVIAELYGGRS